MDFECSWISGSILAVKEIHSFMPATISSACIGILERAVVFFAMRNCV